MRIPLEKLSLHTTLLQISNSANRTSQEPWYLIIVSKNNYLLQTEKYQFILPCKSRFGIHQIFIPPFIQRVDPIAKNSINDSIILPDNLINLFPCGLLSYSVRINNLPNTITEHVRNNYYLNLNKPYEELYKNYNNGHKLNLKQAIRQNIKVSISNDIAMFVEYYQKHSHSAIPKSYKKEKLISSIVTECLNRKSGMIYKVENQNNEILACAFIRIHHNRLVYLLSSSSTEGKKQFAMYFAIDEIIKNYSNSNLILDFEGSMIPGIAYFMKGFGAELENYYVYEWNEHWICKLKNKLRKLC